MVVPYLKGSRKITNFQIIVRQRLQQISERRSVARGYLVRVGFGVTALAKGMARMSLDGIGVHTRHLLENLEVLGDIQVSRLAFGANFARSFAGPTEITNSFRVIAAWSFFTGLAYPGLKNFFRDIDVFHAPDHHIPKSLNTPIVATIHDAIPISNPEWNTMRYRTLIAPVFKRTASWANKIITVSNYSKCSLVEHFNISSELIAVVPNGVDKSWFNPSKPEAISDLRKRYDLPRRYIISVGTLQPRKNTLRLIEAYCSLPQDLQKNHDLVLVGREGWKCQSILSRVSQGAPYGRILWLRYLPDDELQLLVKAAECFAFPSLSEGFGLPVLEAFAGKVPVITSNVTALPEVAGDAAVLVDPYTIDSIVHELSRVLDDTTLSNNLRSRGSDRAKLFSWEQVASRTINVYRGVL